MCVCLCLRVWEHANNHWLIIHSLFSSSLSRSLNLQTFHYSLDLFFAVLHCVLWKVKFLVSCWCELVFCHWHEAVTACGVQRTSNFINVTVIARRRSFLQWESIPQDRDLLIITSHCVFSDISCDQQIKLLVCFVWKLVEKLRHHRISLMIKKVFFLASSQLFMEIMKL